MTERTQPGGDPIVFTSETGVTRPDQLPTIRCSRPSCGKPLPRQLFDTDPGNVFQFDNNAPVKIEWHGAYGMFTDCLVVCEPPTEHNLCHECAHELADFLSVDVHNWHTHSVESGQHPDHHNPPPSFADGKEGAHYPYRPVFQEEDICSTCTTNNYPEIVNWPCPVALNPAHGFTRYL